jgi:outer membrane receptor for ferrienterochelin and colicins
MKPFISYLFCFALFFTLSSNISANKPPAATINGQVTANGEPLPFASIQIRSTTIGTATDINGNYKLEVPSGPHQLRVQALGYKPIEISINTDTDIPGPLVLNLEEDALQLEQVVVTADRDARKRRESSVIVNTLSTGLLSTLQSTSLSEGLAFCPGIRVENTCGNCGSNQLRMNGLEGPYSQLLINGRPIFSGLASVYGLELMPANMIERVEVVRGGGSALYGSNAIAGTVNIITKEPVNNQYEVQLQTALVGTGSNIEPDNTIQFNTTLASENSRHGLAIYGFHRNRSPYDDNNDGYSELSKIKNSTMGMHYSVKPGYKSRFTADYFHINEMRRGGDAFDKPLHESTIAEATDHLINSGNFTYQLYTAPDQEFSLYAAGQSVNRDSYYGAGQALDAYGNTKDFSFSAGSQYKILSGANNIIFGAELNGGRLEDEKLGYRTYSHSADEDEIIQTIWSNTPVSDQRTLIGGLFSQWERRLGVVSLSAGIRMDRYSISDELSDAAALSNTVLSPRLNILYGIDRDVQMRVSYAKGYRAPQIFDEDLHIETSAARQVFHKNDPNLKQETSHSYMGSVSYQNKSGSSNLELLAELFYTDLKNPFANELGDPDENGVVIYTRVNEDEGAIVKGINMETTWLPSSRWRFNGSYTLQSSKFGGPQDFDESRFFRTPDQYGYFLAEWNSVKNLSFSTTGTYTGIMLVPYFGPTLENPEDGELRETEPFFDWSLKLEYRIKTNNGTFQLFAGMKNIFNSYQKDIDTGEERDPGYVYGPISPRMVHFGIKINNLL